MIWHLFARRYLATQVRMVVLVFCVAAAVAFGLLAAAFRVLADEAMSPPVIVGFSLMFAAIAASCACLVALMRIARFAQARVDGDFPHRSAIIDVVVKGRDRELDLDERVLATKYAVALLPYLAFQQAQLLLLCAALLLAQVAMGSGSSNPVTAWATIAVFVAAVAGLGLWVVQSRRVHRFLHDNENLLGTPVR